jgi:hypothetical protein
LYIKNINCIFTFFFFPFGSKYRGFGCRNIDQAGSSASITSKSLNNKDRSVKTRNVCRPGNEKIQCERGRKISKSFAPYSNLHH